MEGPGASKIRKIASKIIKNRNFPESPKCFVFYFLVWSRFCDLEIHSGALGPRNIDNEMEWEIYFFVQKQKVNPNTSRTSSFKEGELRSSEMRFFQKKLKRKKTLNVSAKQFCFFLIRNRDFHWEDGGRGYPQKSRCELTSPDSSELEIEKNLTFWRLFSKYFLKKSWVTQKN